MHKTAKQVPDIIIKNFWSINIFKLEMSRKSGTKLSRSQQKLRNRQENKKKKERKKERKSVSHQRRNERGVL